ncbi:MAG TPA: hypothetical protein VIG76_10420 [Amnibacterium sp.]|jgi:hypothetical protein|uniref:hypothetical protein n=1 Tax=Amnibacterium sp. TaxID=1872496 RepID=UPI002F91FB5B
MAIPEVGRLFGHVLLDAVAAWDDEADEALNERTLNLALARLDEIEAIRVTLDDQDTATVDASDVLGPAVMLLLQAVRLASLRGPAREVVIADLRRDLDDG